MTKLKITEHDDLIKYIDPNLACTEIHNHVIDIAKQCILEHSIIYGDYWHFVLFERNEVGYCVFFIERNDGKKQVITAAFRFIRYKGNVNGFICLPQRITHIFKSKIPETFPKECARNNYIYGDSLNVIYSQFYLFSRKETDNHWQIAQEMCQRFSLPMLEFV